MVTLKTKPTFLVPVPAPEGADRTQQECLMICFELSGDSSEHWLKRLAFISFISEPSQGQSGYDICDDKGHEGDI